mgnify:CR=1 FL=1
MKHILSSAQKQLIQLTIAALLLVGCNRMDLAYRNLGQYASPWGTYGDGVDNGQKGIEGGVSWTVFRNIQFFAKYFNGKDRVANKDAQKLFARFDVFF